MTGNVAQVFLTDESWMNAIQGIRSTLAGRGAFVFEETMETCISESTSTFRSLEEIEQSLESADRVIGSVGETQDRPGREFVVVAGPAEHRQNLGGT